MEQRALRAAVPRGDTFADRAGLKEQRQFGTGLPETQAVLDSFDVSQCHVVGEPGR